jgi:hypothetical protein
MRSIAEIIDTDFDGAEIVEALNTLHRKLAEATATKGVETSLVFTIQKPDGCGIAVVTKNGAIITEPLQIGIVADEAADKVRMLACTLARARMC